MRSLFIVCWFLLLSAAALAQTAFDPLSVAVGARAMGMGRACAAVAEEGDAIFTNPAGLGELDTFQFTTMSARLLNEVTYTVLGGTYPLGNKSALGFGFAAASLSGIEVRDAGGAYISRSDFGSAVILASYGRKLSEKLSLGVNLKYFNQSANEVTDGNGTGFNLDVGVLQKGLGWFSLGAVAKNVLSTRMRYNNGAEEPLPTVVKVGARMHILGKEFESAVYSPLTLVAAADADLSLHSFRSTTAHAGLELSPVPYLTLRAGIDQDPRAGSPQNFLTSGLSLRFAGISFHYAYHPYAELAEDAAHYFSITFDERGWPYEGPPDIFLGSTP